MPRYLVQVDGKEYDIELEYRQDAFEATINGEPVDLKRHHIAENRSVLLIDGQSIEFDVRQTDAPGERLVFMKGIEVPVIIENYQLAQLRKRAGMSSAGAVNKTISAPMPGLVIDIKVAPGDAVGKGQPLLIIEAMKMENVMKSPADGIVKAVHARTGSSVDKNDKLIELE